MTKQVKDASPLQAEYQKVEKGLHSHYTLNGMPTLLKSVHEHCSFMECNSKTKTIVTLGSSSPNRSASLPSIPQIEADRVVPLKHCKHSLKK